MRTKLFLGLSIALLAMSCTSETEPRNEDVTKITKIQVGAEQVANPETRTVTDVTANRVTWAAGDEIAVFRVGGEGRMDYRRFVLESGAGDVLAYFKGVGADDFLTAGDTYKVVYPYNSVREFDGLNGEFNMTASISGNNNTDHLARFNWLISTPHVIPTDGTMPSFSLAQAMALAKIRLDVKNFALPPLDEQRYLTNLNFTTIDKKTVFSSSVYWSAELDLKTKKFSEVASAGFTSGVQVYDNTTYYYWVPIMQDPSFGIKDLKLEVLWRSGLSNTYSSSMEYTPKSIFAPGFIYNIHFVLTFEPSGNSGTLSLVP